VQSARLLGADRSECVRAEAERLGPEVRELRVGGLRRQQPHARALLRPCLGEHELGAALELEPERGRLRPLLARPQVAEATRGHQVHEQDELAVLGREHEPFRPPTSAREPPPVERRQRRIERLQRRDVRRPGFRYRERPHGLVQLAPPCLHLG
jgi:hypothetical protein